ncbi:collagen alpha-1(I) chain-like [Tiliqua scincoides]|uniref:collagen alpha-1(I) chain-like n=1 Tax=Tiliqua scincoides TaxID=71010 RepID=UPI003461D06E
MAQTPSSPVFGMDGHSLLWAPCPGRGLGLGAAFPGQTPKPRFGAPDLPHEGRAARLRGPLEVPSGREGAEERPFEKQHTSVPAEQRPPRLPGCASAERALQSRASTDIQGLAADAAACGGACPRPCPEQQQQPAARRGARSRGPPPRPASPPRRVCAPYDSIRLLERRRHLVCGFVLPRVIDRGLRPARGGDLPIRSGRPAARRGEGRGGRGGRSPGSPLTHAAVDFEEPDVLGRTTWGRRVKARGAAPPAAESPGRARAGRQGSLGSPPDSARAEAERRFGGSGAALDAQWEPSLPRRLELRGASTASGETRSSGLAAVGRRGATRASSTRPASQPRGRLPAGSPGQVCRAEPPRWEQGGSLRGPPPRSASPRPHGSPRPPARGCAGLLCTAQEARRPLRPAPPSRHGKAAARSQAWVCSPPPVSVAGVGEKTLRTAAPNCGIGLASLGRALSSPLPPCARHRETERTEASGDHEAPASREGWGEGPSCGAGPKEGLAGGDPGTPTGGSARRGGRAARLAKSCWEADLSSAAVPAGSGYPSWRLVRGDVCEAAGSAWKEEVSTAWGRGGEALRRRLFSAAPLHARPARRGPCQPRIRAARGRGGASSPPSLLLPASSPARGLVRVVRGGHGRLPARCCGRHSTELERLRCGQRRTARSPPAPPARPSGPSTCSAARRSPPRPPARGQPRARPRQAGWHRGPHQGPARGPLGSKSGEEEPLRSLGAGGRHRQKGCRGPAASPAGERVAPPFGSRACPIFRLSSSSARPPRLLGAVIDDSPRGRGQRGAFAETRRPLQAEGLAPHGSAARGLRATPAAPLPRREGSEPPLACPQPPIRAAPAEAPRAKGGAPALAHRGRKRTGRPTPRRDERRGPAVRPEK